MTLPAMTLRSLRLLALLLPVLLAAGCATTSQVAAPAKAEHNAAFAQARQLAGQRAQLSGPALAENTRQIKALLAGIDNASLARDSAALPVGDPLYPLAGSALQDRGLALPRPFERDAGWQFDADGRPPADRDGYRPPQKLAVLLPLSGPLAVAAAPVRDGLLAGYYGEARRRPEITFYDTTGTPAGALAAYAKAVTGGAELVLGPLGRDEVDALFRQGGLKVPVVALNRGEVAPPPATATFSLAPEAEGISVADYLLRLERGKVLVIAGNDDTSTRAATAFRARLAEGGGSVVDTLVTADPPANLSAALAAASAKGVDAVFLAMRGSTARGIVPQLALAGLSGKTRVGTSQLLQGTGKPADDAVLDGVIYPTEAWTATGTAGLPPASQVAATVPTARGGAARLFAFGFDAWLLSAYLPRVALNANGRLQGATGTLTLDAFGNVLRAPAWGTFSGGQPSAFSGG